MKKFAIILIALAVNSFLYGQKDGNGFCFSMNHSNVKLFHEDGTQTKGEAVNLLSAGLFGSVHFNDRVGLMSEIRFYNGIGTDYTDTIDNPALPTTMVGTDKLRIKAFNWNIFVPFSFNDNVSVYAGSSVDFILNRKFKDDMNIDDHTAAMKTIIDPEGLYGNKLLKVNGLVGVGAGIGLLRFDVRYIIGLNNLVGPSFPTDYPYTKITYSYLQAGIAVVVPGLEFRKIEQKYKFEYK